MVDARKNCLVENKNSEEWECSLKMELQRNNVGWILHRVSEKLCPLYCLCVVFVIRRTTLRNYFGNGPSFICKSFIQKHLVVIWAITKKKPMTRGANLLPPFQASFTCFNIYFYEYTLYQLSCFSNHYTGRQRIGVSGGKPKYCAKTDRLWDFWAAFSQASYWFQIHDQCCNEKQKKVGRCRGKGVVMHFCAEGERNCCFFRKFPIYWHCLEVFTGLIWA